MIAIDYIAIVIAILAIVLICWGVVISFIEFLRLEIRRFKGVNICHPRELLRHHLGSYLLLGLEFLIAADIIHTIIQPTLDEVIILGLIVAIRTILNYFLNREIAQHTCANE